jgi:hypothetical protein
MWSLCNEARDHLTDQVWLDRNVSAQPASKAKIRELTYHALIKFLEAKQR